VGHTAEARWCTRRIAVGQRTGLEEQLADPRSLRPGAQRSQQRRADLALEDKPNRWIVYANGQPAAVQARHIAVSRQLGGDRLPPGLAQQADLHGTTEGPAGKQCAGDPPQGLDGRTATVILPHPEEPLAQPVGPGQTGLFETSLAQGGSRWR
jgi:hypothetical protein